MPQIGIAVVAPEGHGPEVPVLPMAQVLLQRDHQEKEDQQGYAQPQQTAFHKGEGAAAVVGHHHEIPGDQEKQAHEERAIHGEERPENGGPRRFLDRPRPAGRSVSLADMVCNHENGQGDPEIVEEEQVLGISHLNPTKIAVLFLGRQPQPTAVGEPLRLMRKSATTVGLLVGGFRTRPTPWHQQLGGQT